MPISLSLRSTLKINFSIYVFIGICLGSCSRTAQLQSLNASAIPQKVANVEVDFCTDPASAAKTNSKLVVILDHSGSNQSNYIMGPDGTADINATTPYANQLVNGINLSSLATDPNGKTRYGDVNTPQTLLNYLYNLSPNDPKNPKQFFALIDFSSTARVPYANDPITQSAFTSDTSCFYGIVQADALGKTAPCNPSGANPTSIADDYLPPPDASSVSSIPTVSSVPPSSVAPPSVARPTDGGGTSYVQPLIRAYNLIANDIQQAEACAALPPGGPVPGCANGTGVRVSSSYVVVFMTDGTPSTGFVAYSGAGGCSYAPVLATDPEPGYDTCSHNSWNSGYYFWIELQTSILAQVKSLMKLKAAYPSVVEGINLYSIYYYYQPPVGSSLAAPADVPNVDPNSQSILRQMASVGNGMFYNVASGSNINYAQFIAPTQMVKYTLADIFVSNSSVTWWSDGKLKADSDKDGLPDAVELTLGSDPFNADSDGNGIGDLVEYKISGQPCQAKDSNGMCIGAPRLISMIGGKCVVPNDGLAYLGDCNANFQWLLLPTGQIQLNGTSSCLGPQNRQIAAGVNMALLPCDINDPYQKWNANASFGATNMTVQLAASGYGYCMDDDHNVTADGTPIIIWPCHGQQNQRWTFPLAPLPQSNSGACAGLPTVTPQLPANARPVSPSLTYLHTSPDGLNDCEKLILNTGGSYIQPDSNGDLIPDWLEFKNFVSFQFGFPVSVDVNQTDGYSLYEKVKYFLPTSISTPDSAGFSPLAYHLSQTTSTHTQDCYQLTVPSVQTIGDNNAIRVDVILKSRSYVSDYVYHKGIKNIPTGTSNILFNDWNDSAENAAGTWSNWQ